VEVEGATMSFARWEEVYRGLREPVDANKAKKGRRKKRRR